MIMLDTVRCYVKPELAKLFCEHSGADVEWLMLCSALFRLLPLTLLYEHSDFVVVWLVICSNPDSSFAL